jgi:hypothetical protein
MKSIFEPGTHAELLERLGKLTPETERQWGKMSASQMMEHTARTMEMATGKNGTKQSLIGKVVGWAVKPGFLSEKPVPRNAPTAPLLSVKDDPDFAAARDRFEQLLKELHELGESGTEGNIHVFFGALSGKQWGETQYKHVDHHLQQFGV